MRYISSKSVTHPAAFLFLLLSLLIPAISFAQENDLSGAGFLHKQQALNKLGNRLTTVAAKHGKTSNELRRMFLRDSALHIDKNDRLLYIDRAPNASELAAAQETPGAPQAAPYPLAQTFTLHSRPGSNRTIYLDFDGHTIDASNLWYGYLGGTGGVAQPFDIDANPTFNTTELEAIQAIWQRISEDFAPFDVDVTTEYTGEDAILRNDYTDQRYGTRAVLTTTNFMGAGVGGVAYVGIFDFTGGEIYQPAWIFTAGFGSAKSIAEAASHEIGHNLGLSHDGTSQQGYYGGQGVWAPIMGVGYSKSVSQWSKGEYYDANNQEDDLAIIQSHGATLIADDYGDTSAAARVLSGSSINVSGLITTRTDVDVFKFTTGSGNISININSAPVGGNLDIKAQILDAAGNVVAVSDPSSIELAASFPAGISASFNQFLSAGTYYLTVDGVGIAENDNRTGYSDYASIGQYSISGNLASGGGTQQAPTAIVSANPLSGTAPLTVDFSGAGSFDPDGSIIGYSWNFGDGTNSAAQNPSKIYNSAGTFTANLTVTDNSGLTSSSSVLINVTNPVNVSSIAGRISYGITPAGQSTRYVSGISITASGWSNASTSTGADGSYLIGNLINGGQYTVTPTKTGNVNGISTFDATLIMRHVAAAGVGANALAANQQIAADVNNDGMVTSFDATQILRYVAANGANAGTGQIGSWRFSPSPRAYGSVTGALTNQNYEAFLIGEVTGDWSSTVAGIIESEKKDQSDQTETALQQPEAQVQISLPANSSGQNGSSVLIPINLTNTNTPIGAFTIEVIFDPNVLQPQPNPIITSGTLSDSTCQVLSNTFNTGSRLTLRIAAACPSNLNGSGTLLNLRFNVVGMANTSTGTTTLEFTVRSDTNQVPLFQNDNGTIPVVVVNGSFTVFSPAQNSSATVAGRILNADGRGLRNTLVRLTAANGSSKIVPSGPFGNYRFTNIVTGQTITIEVISKRLGFQPQSLNVTADVLDLNFIGQP